MARIRTIKPDFWTDEKITECSVSARLLLIGLLNFADDNGNLRASVKRIKMQVFPADAIDCQPLLNELITHGMLIEYSVNNENYLHIKGFSKHQRVNRPSATDIPKPDSDGVQEVLSEDSLTEGKGIGREGNSNTPSLRSGESPSPVPYQDLHKIWNEEFANTAVAQVQVLSDKRKTSLKARWHGELERDLARWRSFCQLVKASEFLCGKNDRSWIADFEWAMKPDSITKTLEGKYKNGSNSKNNGQNYSGNNASGKLSVTDATTQALAAIKRGEL